jgi:[acyl-carrier-protein] S-malonyltransferase
MKGTFTRAARTPREAGDTVEAGEVVATVKSLRDELEVSAPHGGIVVEWLVEEGDPVSPGQPLVRLHPSVGN